MNTSRGALASFLFATLALPGCDDPPTCKLQTGIMGAAEGAANWSLSGEEECTFVEAASLGLDEGTAMVFTQGDSQFILVVDTPAPQVGAFLGRAFFLSGGFVWQAPAGSCTVAITEFDRENWSLHDFVQVEGSFQCGDPLTPTSPEVGDITLTTLTFNAHLYDDLGPSSIF